MLASRNERGGGTGIARPAALENDLTLELLSTDDLQRLLENGLAAHLAVDLGID